MKMRINVGLGSEINSSQHTAATDSKDDGPDLLKNFFSQNAPAPGNKASSGNSVSSRSSVSTISRLRKKLTKTLSSRKIKPSSKYSGIDCGSDEDPDEGSTSSSYTYSYGYEQENTKGKAGGAMLGGVAAVDSDAESGPEDDLSFDHLLSFGAAAPRGGAATNTKGQPPQFFETGVSSFAESPVISFLASPCPTGIADSNVMSFVSSPSSDLNDDWELDNDHGQESKATIGRSQQLQQPPKQRHQQKRLDKSCNVENINSIPKSSGHSRSGTHKISPADRILHPQEFSKAPALPPPEPEERKPSKKSSPASSRLKSSKATCNSRSVSRSASGSNSIIHHEKRHKKDSIEESTTDKKTTTKKKSSPKVAKKKTGSKPKEVEPTNDSSDEQEQPEQEEPSYRYIVCSDPGRDTIMVKGKTDIEQEGGTCTYLKLNIIRVLNENPCTSTTATADTTTAPTTTKAKATKPLSSNHRPRNRVSHSVRRNTMTSRAS